MKEKPHAILIAGAPARYPDIRHAAGFFSFDPVILLRTKGRQSLVVSPLDAAYARRTVKQTTVYSFSDFPSAKNSRTPLCDRIIGLLRKVRVSTVTVPPYFPVALARQIEARKIALKIAERDLFPERQVKTQREIEYIRHAQKAAVHAMKAAVKLISGAKITRNRLLKTGRHVLTAEAVRRRIASAALEFNCVCQGTIVAGGKQAANPHETGFGPLRAGELIVIDIFPQHVESGYFGDLTRTICRGSPPPRIGKIYAAVRAAQKAAISKIKDGVPAKEVHNAAVELFHARGFAARRIRGRETGFIHTTGHGIGLEVHEGPRVAPVDTKLNAGNVVTIEPGLYYPGECGVRIEDIVLVRQHGATIIEPYSYPFVV
jgi:Xaa-Pro aminopeptidase